MPTNTDINTVDLPRIIELLNEVKTEHFKAYLAKEAAHRKSRQAWAYLDCAAVLTPEEAQAERDTLAACRVLENKLNMLLCMYRVMLDKIALTP